ncbi:MAG: hypothetical protein AABZ26_03965 [Chloroflexota bacterium]|mgnify:FL=1
MRSRIGSIGGSIQTVREAPRGSKPSPSYAKISATLEEGVLREIRERTTNVSGFLNEAAKERLYFQRLREADEALERQGVPVDEKLYRNLIRTIDEHRLGKVRREKAAVRRARAR